MSQTDTRTGTKCSICGGSGMTAMATIALALPARERRELDQCADDNPVRCWSCKGTGFTDAQAGDVKGLVERLCNGSDDHATSMALRLEAADALEHLSNDAAAAIAANHALAILVRGLERLSTPQGNQETNEKEK